MKDRKVFTATISSATTTSDAVDLDGYTPAAIYFPAGMTGTTITFEAAEYANDTFTQVTKSDNSAVSLTIDSTAKNFVLEPKEMYGRRYIKVKSASSEGSERSIQIVGVLI